MTLILPPTLTLTLPLIATLTNPHPHPDPSLSPSRSLNPKRHPQSAPTLTLIMYL